MQIKPTIALLISTYNWPEALNLVLAAVQQQTILPDEIIIADDGSDERTKTIVQSYHSKFSVPIKHIWHEDKGFRKSLILNKAVKQIVSDYIIEIDGDIIIHPKFIADHLQVAENGYFVQGSRTMINEAKSKEILQTGHAKLSPFSSGITNRLNATRIPLLSKAFILLPSDPFHIKGCNIAFWKKDFIKINGYFNGFEGWGAEDYEFGARLLHSDVKRKTLKMSAIGYHIFHGHNTRDNRVPNDKIYRKTLADKATYASDGYQQV